MNKYTPEPIWLTLRPSRHLIAYLVFTHAAALLALTILQAPPGPRATAAVCLMLSLLWHWRRYAMLRGLAAVRRVHWRTDGDWWLTTGEGQVSVYHEVDIQLLQPWLTILHLEGRSGRFWLLLPGDSADADHLRRLRVRLQRHRARDQVNPLRGT